MIRRSTWAIVLIFVALLVAAVLLRQNKARNPEPTPTSSATPVFAFAEADIQGLVVQDSLGKQAAMQRGADGAWSITAPTPGPADSSRVDLAVRQWAGLESLTTLAEAPAADATGLAAPAYTVTVELKDGQKLVTRVGSLTPTQSGYYLQVGEGPVQVVSRFAVEEVTRLAEELPYAPTPTPAAGTPTPEATLPATP